MSLRNRLTALHGADDDAVAAFWADVAATGTPVVEDRGAAGTVRVTFLWRAARPRAVHCGIARVTDRDAWRTGLMTRVPGTDVWWLECSLPDTLRAGYSFRVFSDRAPRDDDFAGRPWERRDPVPVADPTAPAPPVPGVGGATTTELALPGAPLPGLAAAVGAAPAARGVTEHGTPWGTAWTWVPKGASTLLVLTDGRTWTERLDLPRALATMDLPVAVAALDSGTRQERTARLGGDTGYAEFLADGFLPWARGATGVDGPVDRTWFAGQSLGGLTALLLATRRPGAFGTVVAQSPSMWWHPDGDRTPADMPALDERPWIVGALQRPPEGGSTRVHLHAGTLEGTTAHHVGPAAARLRELGHDAVATTFTGGHEALCWRAGLVDLLRRALGGAQP
uniref:DUF3327 domain-containing protein n=1 Tax=Neobacillus citreus TaxID=2833578 RepID=A0A942SX40_9BACI